MSIEKKGLYRTFREAIWGAPKEQKPASQTNVLIMKSDEHGYGKKLGTTFKDQVDTFLEDPVIQQSIQQSAQEICSTGFFTSQNDEYTLKLGGKTAKDVIDEWNRENDIDAKIFQVAVELVAFGNSFWKISDGGFTSIPVDAVEKAQPIDKFTDIRDKYNIKLTGTYGNGIIKWQDFLHFRTSVTGTAPLGTGIILGLLESPDDETPSIIEIRNSVRTSMKMGFEKFSFGNELWSLEGADSGSMAALAEHVKNMSPTGNRIVTNGKGTVALAVPQRTQSYDKWVETIDKEFYMSLGAGINPGTEYTTKATAEAIRTVYEQKIASLRRVIKRIYEDLWSKILDKLGYDGSQAQVKLHFGSKEVEYTTQDVFSAVDKGVLSKEEARRILREYMGWRLEKNALPAQPVVPPQPAVLPVQKEALPPQDIKVNVKVTSEPVKLTAEPLKTEVSIKTEPQQVKLTSEPLKIEPIQVKTEPAQVTVTLKEPEQDQSLVALKKQVLQNISDKVKKI